MSLGRSMARPRCHVKLLLFFSILMAFQPMAPRAQGQDVVSGMAEVIDADILRIGPQRVILWGIDAPERRQSCYRDGARWGCAEAARRALELLSGRGEVRCLLLDAPDAFGRRHGICESGGEDIGAEMVRRGLALAYVEQTDAYLPLQMEAILAEAGVWAPGVEMEAPWDFRRQNTPGGLR